MNQNKLRSAEVFFKEYFKNLKWHQRLWLKIEVFFDRIYVLVVLNVRYKKYIKDIKNI